MKRAVLVSQSLWRVPFKVGLHFFGETLWQEGWEVVFVTAGMSWLSIAAQAPRVTPEARRDANRLRRERERLWSYVWLTPWHPANLRSDVLNRICAVLFRHYGRLSLRELEPMIRGADLFIFEGASGILLFDRFKHASPKARFVYRVADDMLLLGMPPVVLAAERCTLPRFDLVSVPSPHVREPFRGLPNLRQQLQAIDKAAFDRQYPDPYGAEPRRRAVFVGRSWPFDADFLERASRLLPDWVFHIIGPIGDLPDRANVMRHGELPFDQTIAYLRHADAGLQTLLHRPRIEWMATSSLKLVQYTYCRLPVIAPEFLRTPLKHVFYYRPGDDASILRAFRAASHLDRRTVSTDGIHTWSELTRLIAGESEPEARRACLA
jgi:2-beta-glucuronyltransferase